MVPRHLNDPLTIIARRVHRASHSSILKIQMVKIRKKNSVLINMHACRHTVKHPHQAVYLCEVRTTARLS